MSHHFNENANRRGIEEPDESKAADTDQEFLHGSDQEPETDDVDVSHEAAEFIIDATMQKPPVKASTTYDYMAGMASGNPYNPALEGYDF